MNVGRGEIVAAVEKTDGGARRGRAVFQGDGGAHVFHVERQAVADDEDEDERQDDAEQDAAAVAFHLLKFLAREGEEPPKKSTEIHLIASSRLRASSTMRMKTSFMSAAGIFMRARISAGLPRTSIVP